MAHRRLRIGCLGAIALLLVLAVAVTGFLWFQGRKTPTGEPTYVALGSSYAAGAGLGRLQPGSPLACARSVNGYPQQFARRRHLSIVDMSCGGAVTANVLHGGQFFQGPQVRVITNDTRLVTLTIGGNDVGYVGDLSMLAARRTDSLFGRLVRAFWHGPKTSAERHYDDLHRALLETLRSIRQRAPHATIVVATYPTVMPPAGTCPQIGLSAAEATAMRQVGDRLAAVTRDAAAKGGAVLVDMNALGAAHHACAAAPWTAGWSNATLAPFHPTLAGAEATAAAVSAAIGSNASTPLPGSTRSD